MTYSAVTLVHSVPPRRIRLVALALVAGLLVVDGAAMIGGTPDGTGAPPSERGRYPITAVPAPEPSNDAVTETVPAGETAGFDERTSVELPSERGTHHRVYANADGTRTTEFSAAPLHYPGAGRGMSVVDSLITTVEYDD